ncbi:MAG: N-acetylmuramate alpha-1-phosphate uridylyltransferase MurU [Burkholderiales bacterium]
MILAAGRGERMRPLTDATPKPLLRVGGKPLIVWHIEKLGRAGFAEIVINTSWLAPQIHAALGQGEAWNVKLTYSDEQPAPYETGGGMATALQYLGQEPFLAVSADIWTDFDYARVRPLPENSLAHLWLVPNPDFHPQGDFSLAGEGKIGFDLPRLTFANLGWYHPALFQGVAPRQWVRLLDLLKPALGAGRVTGEILSATWHNLGTPSQLAALDHLLTERHEA